MSAVHPAASPPHSQLVHTEPSTENASPSELHTLRWRSVSILPPASAMQLPLPFPFTLPPGHLWGSSPVNSNSSEPHTPNPNPLPRCSAPELMTPPNINTVCQAALNSIYKREQTNLFDNFEAQKPSDLQELTRDLTQNNIDGLLRLASSDWLDYEQLLLQYRYDSLRNPENLLLPEHPLPRGNGLAPLVQALVFETTRGPSSSGVNSAIQWAASIRHPLLEALIKTDRGKEGLSQRRDIALENAASGGQLNLVKQFLSDSTSPRSINNALKNAAAMGHEEIVKILLNTQQSSMEDLDRALDSAAKYSRKNIIEILLDPTRAKQQPSQRGVDAALATALQQLLSQGQFRPMTDLSLTAFISSGERSLSPLNRVLTATVNRFLMMNKLQGQRPSQTAFEDTLAQIMRAGKGLDEVFIAMAEAGDEKIIQRFLELGTALSQPAIDLALIKAAEAGHRATIEVLLNNNKDLKAPSQEGIDRALTSAAVKDCKTIVEILLAPNKAGEPSRKAIDHALRAAARRGSKTSFVTLLNAQVAEGPSQEGIDDAFGSAAREGHEAIFLLLVTSGRLSQAGFDTALVSAAIGGQQKLVDHLLTMRRCSPMSIGSALQAVAIVSQYTKCEANLEKLAPDYYVKRRPIYAQMIPQLRAYASAPEAAAASPAPSFQAVLNK